MGRLPVARLRIEKHRWPLVGLFVVLVFLEHDALMAADAHSADLHNVSVHVPPTTANGCDVGRTAAVPSDASLCLSPLSTGDLLGSPPIGLAEMAGIDLLADRSLGPSWSPEVRRALLQVYLI